MTTVRPKSVLLLLGGERAALPLFDAAAPDDVPGGDSDYELGEQLVLRSLELDDTCPHIVTTSAHGVRMAPRLTQIMIRQRSL
jgi:hypothetical protein